MIEFGDFMICCVNDGFFKLDGGAMFGIVPKPVWEKNNPADEKNRIPLSLNCLLIQNRKTTATILVDTGIGVKNNETREKFRKFYDFKRSCLVENIYNIMGLLPQDISFVVNTHLHLDHAGGNTYFCEKEGKEKITFYNARYIVQKGELEAALADNERTNGSYLKESIKILCDNEDNLMLVDRDNKEIIKGVSIIKTGGHTGHHQCVKIVSGGRTAFYLGDLIPTVSHLNPVWIMGYDLYPLDTLYMKEKLLNQACEENWLLVFEHDPEAATGYLRKDNDGWKIERVEKVQ